MEPGFMVSITRPQLKRYFATTALFALAALAAAPAAAGDLAAVEPAQDGRGVAAEIKGAKSGDTVALPAGTFEITGVDVPAGVRVKGAVNNTGSALSATDTTGSAVFNKVMDGSPIVVSLAGDNGGLILDHNFYLTHFIGKGKASRAPRSCPQGLGLARYVQTPSGRRTQVS